MHGKSSAFWSLGLRPFYLLGAADMIAGVGFWGLSLAGLVAPLDVWWHARETLFGAVLAIAAGFLLTAVPRWTGRDVAGPGMLKFLVLLWLLARSEQFVSNLSGIFTSAFLIVLIASIGQAVTAGGNRRQMVLVGLLTLLGISWSAASGLWGIEQVELGLWGGICAFVLIISMIGGRVIPTFLDNAGQGRTKAFRRAGLDGLTVMASALALVLLAPAEPWPFARSAALVAGTLQVVRFLCWRPWRAGGNLLLAILPIGYLWVPTGFLLAALPDMPRVVALHAFSAGAMGVMMLALMVRSARGHTGRPLRASRLDACSFALVEIGAILRVGAGIWGGHPHLLACSGILWAAAFVVFLAAWVVPLLSPRVDAVLEG